MGYILGKVNQLISLSDQQIEEVPAEQLLYMHFSILLYYVLVFYVTCNDISVIYVTAQMVQADLRRSYTYDRAPNAIDISQGSLTCPSYTDTGPSFLYGFPKKPPHLVAFYDTLGI